MGNGLLGLELFPNQIKNFNLVNITYDKVSGEGNIQTTKYFEIMKKAYQNVYG